MASLIDPAKPQDGEPAVKADLRANLGAAKDEIEALQAGKSDVGHGHPLSDIEAAGTPDGATFLRGDGTWADSLTGAFTVEGGYTLDGGGVLKGALVLGDGVEDVTVGSPLQGGGKVTTHWAIGIDTHNEAYALAATDRTRRLVFTDSVERTWKIPDLPPGEIMAVNRSTSSTLSLMGTTVAAGDPADVTVNGTVGGTVALGPGEAATILSYGDASVDVFKGARASVS